MQYFKGDENELKIIACLQPMLDAIALQFTDFYDDAYETYPLGDVIFDSQRSPLSNAIRQDIFREAYNEIFAQFAIAGTFESYMNIFTKIFGDEVEVTFTVPGAGKLTIDITAAGIEESIFVARRVSGYEYVFDEIIDYDDDNIVFQTVKGFESQYELERMLREMVPAGIVADINLTLLGD